MSRKKALINTLFDKFPFTDTLLRRAARRTQQHQLLILNYHLVSEQESSFFDWCNLPLSLFYGQMQYMANHFHVIHLSHALSKQKETHSCQKPPVVITFDDGFKNNFTTAFPVLQHFNLPATIFLTTGFIGSESTIWFGQLFTALDSSPKKTLQWDNRTFNLYTPELKASCFQQLQKHLKQYPHKVLLKKLNEIIPLLGLNPTTLKINSSSPYRMLNEEDILQMRDSELIEFGAHTVDHCILSKLDNDQQQKQIHESLNTVRQLTQQKNVPFAYPNGLPADYTANSIQYLKQHKAHSAVTMINGFNGPHTNPYELRRIGVGGDWKPGIFKFAVHTALIR